nr:alpha/beta hydrolase family protein [Skermania sp. ID1734]
MLPVVLSVVACLTAPNIAAADPAPGSGSSFGPAPAPPPPPTPRNGAAVDHIDVINSRQWNVYVYSPSMNKVILLQVIRPADTSRPRPTYYVLNGGGGGEDPANWYRQSDIVSFFADKNVNVVTPVGGRLTYYTDWERPDPAMGGVNKWTTFFTKELPPVLDQALGANGVNAIAGLSTSGSAVLSLAEWAPGLYRAVGAFSGCAHTSVSPGRDYVNAVVTVGGGNTVNMWGPPGDPDWVANDAYVNADKLRGTALYLASGNGLMGPHDNLGDPSVAGDPLSWVGQVTVGGVIEAATDQCTQELAARLQQLGIPATVADGPGTHSWGYWQDDLHKSWPLIAQAIGA